MKKTNDTLSRQLHCNPVIIPIEFEQKAKSLASAFVKTYTIPNQVYINYSIAYNRACNCIMELLKTTPNFTPRTFDSYLYIGNLFYSPTDIDTLVTSYKSNPTGCYDYIQCFFAVSLKKVRATLFNYIKFVDQDDLISALQIGVIKALDSYDAAKGHFSFQNFNLIVRSCVFELLGDSNIWGFNRNEFSEYYHLCSLFKKYNLSIDQLERFLFEFRLSEEEIANERNLSFDISSEDKQYKLSGVTISKAKNFYHLYIAESIGISPLTVYDESTDTMSDMTPGKIDDGYMGAELKLYIDQVCQTPQERYILEHIMSGNTSFTAKELKDRNINRYQIKIFLERIKKDFI